MGTAEIEAFLTHLAVKENVGASTQNQALSAFPFLYRVVLKKDLDGSIDAMRAKKPVRHSLSGVQLLYSHRLGTPRSSGSEDYDNQRLR